MELVLDHLLGRQVLILGHVPYEKELRHPAHVPHAPGEAGASVQDLADGGHGLLVALVRLADEVPQPCGGRSER
jgi:hypothetical protein